MAMVMMVMIMLSRATTLMTGHCAHEFLTESCRQILHGLEEQSLMCYNSFAGATKQLFNIHLLPPPALSLQAQTSIPRLVTEDYNPRSELPG